MTKKQILVALGVSVFIVCAAMAVSFLRGAKNAPESAGDYEPMTRRDTLVPVPEKLDDIATAIDAESTDDFSVLDEEVAGAEAEIDLDSESITNLGTSYDENSF